MRRPFRLIFSLIPLTFIGLPSVSKAAASFHSVEEPGFYPEVGQGTDADHLRVYGSAFTADSREKTSTQPGLQYQRCGLVWVKTAEEFRDFYNIDYGAEARANFRAHAGGRNIDFSAKEMKVRNSSTPLYAIDIVVVGHHTAIPTHVLRLTPEAKQLLQQNRDKFHENFGTKVMIGYHKGARCVGLIKHACASSAESSSPSANVSPEQKQAMEKDFSMPLAESEVNYVGAPCGAPEILRTREEVDYVFNRLIQHVEKDGGGIKVNWISVPYDQIDDYKAIVIGSTVPFGINALVSNNIIRAYKALMNVRFYIGRITCKLPKDTEARQRMSELEDKVLEIGNKIVEKQEVSKDEIKLISMCESEIWPEEIPQLLDPK